MKPPKSPRIEKRQAKEKAALLEILEDTPVVSVACKKAGIGRQTFYRWLDEDKKFARDVERAQRRGVQKVNDMAESVLMNKIANQDEKTAKWWLEKRHPAYGPKRRPYPEPQPLEEREMETESNKRMIIRLDT